MLQHTAKLIQIIAVLGTFSSIGYYLMCLLAAAKFLRERKTSTASGGSRESTRPVSILKPLKGTDPEMYEGLRSHCLQDYPEYEILLCVDPDDQAVMPLVEKLRSNFPQREIRVLYGSGRVEELVGDQPFDDLDRYITQAELQRLSDDYKRITGFALEDVAQRRA